MLRISPLFPLFFFFLAACQLGPGGRSADVARDSTFVLDSLAAVAWLSGHGWDPDAQTSAPPNLALPIPLADTLPDPLPVIATDLPAAAPRPLPKPGPQQIDTASEKPRPRPVLEPIRIQPPAPILSPAAVPPAVKDSALR